MTRSIVAAVVERPVWRSGPLRVEGPDEDAFTLSVAALERLEARPGPARPIARATVVGSLPSELLPYLRAAIGAPELPAQLAGTGRDALYEALESSVGRAESEGPEALVAVDVAAPARAGEGAGAPASGAGAVAFLVDEGRGARVQGHGVRHHPSSRPPDATEWVRTVRSSAGPAPELGGSLTVRAPAQPPVLLAAWSRELPGLVPRAAPADDPSLGPAANVAPALEILAALRAGAAGPIRVLASIEPERTSYVGFRLDGPIELHGEAPLPPDAPERAPPEASAPEVPGISEGAYVARDRYLEGIPSRWRFVAERCPKCGGLSFPARSICRHCGCVEGLTEELLPREDRRVEARTTVRAGAQPTEFDALTAGTGGYDVVLVRLSPEARATLQGTDRRPGSFRAGDRVDTRLRRLYRSEGEWRYGRKAIPVRPGAAPGAGSA